MNRVPSDRESSRARILAAAVSEFTTFGFAGARVERIARQAHVNKQLLFYYFGSKTGVFRAVLEQAADVAQVATRGTIPAGMADTRLRAALTRLAATLVAHPQLVRLSTEPPSPGTARDPRTRALAALAEPIRAVVLDGQGVGFFRDDVDPEFVAQLALDMALGHMVGKRRTGEEAAAATAWSQKTTDLLIRALGW